MADDLAATREELAVRMDASVLHEAQIGQLQIQMDEAADRNKELDHVTAEAQAAQVAVCRHAAQDKARPTVCRLLSTGMWIETTVCGTVAVAVTGRCGVLWLWLCCWWVLCWIGQSA